MWNSLPDSLRNPVLTSNSFRQSLKTNLFRHYHSAHTAQQRYFTTLCCINLLLTLTLTLTLTAPVWQDSGPETALLQQSPYTSRTQIHSDCSMFTNTVMSLIITILTLQHPHSTCTTRLRSRDCTSATITLHVSQSDPLWSQHIYKHSQINNVSRLVDWC